eukprot:1161879-Pelagomonas_calceolata.AAC.7
MDVPVLRRDLSRIKVGRSSWDRAHIRLWCRAEVPDPLGKNQPGIAQGMSSGTSTPSSRSLSFWQASIPMRD